MNSLYQKNILKISDLNKKEIFKIITLSQQLKKKRKNNKEIQYLKNKKIALIFEQSSTRTRCAFEIAALEQGAYSSYLDIQNMHLGKKESIIDTLHVLERMYDGIVYRGKHNSLLELSKFSKIPIWNGLTEKHHPTQLLADILTIIEYSPKKDISNIVLMYIGDSSNNIANSLLEIANIIGFRIYFVGPEKYWPNQKKILQYEKKYQFHNTCIEHITDKINIIDFLYTDVWISMGESENTWDKKIKLLKKYQINEKLLQLIKNKNLKVLHCLPAIHDRNTILGKIFAKKYDLKNGMEITDKVFQKNKDIIFDQAENRLHTIKALIILSLIANFEIYKP